MKNLKYVILLILIVLFNVYYVDQKRNVDYYDHTSELRLYNSDYYIVKKGDSLEQKIIAKDNNFNKIKVIILMKEFSGESEIKGYLTIGLKDKEGNVISEYQYENIFLNNEQAINFTFPVQKYSEGQEYTLYIKSFKNAYLSLQISENKNNSELLTINGEDTEMSLLLQTYYNKEANVLAYVMFGVITVIMLILIIVLNKFNFVLEKKYLIIAIVLSLLNVFLVPLFHGQDEIYHLYRIYEIGNGDLVSDEIDGWPGYFVPTSFREIKFGNYNEVIEKFIPVNESEKYVGNMEFMAVYSPLSYLPQSIGLNLARLFCDYPIIWSYVIRTFQALFCIVAIYFAIKIIPFAKSIVFLIALIPTCLCATTLMSTDGIMLSTSLLFIAKILQIVYEKKRMEKIDWILISILSIFVAISKLVYFPLLGLLLLIPMNIKKVKKLYIFGIITIALLVMFGWNVIAMKNLVSGQGVNAIYLIKHYFFHPWSFIQIFYNTTVNEIGNFISDLAGGNNQVFGATILDASIIPQIFMFLYLMFIFKGENKLNQKDRKLVLVCFIATYFLICFSLLIACTPVYSSVIKGIQGRYFMALLLPLYLVFAKSKKEYKTFDFDNIIPLIYLFYFLTLFMKYV